MRSRFTRCFPPGRVSSAVFAVLRKLHMSKAVTSNTAPRSRRANRPDHAARRVSGPFAFPAGRAAFAWLRRAEPAGRSSRSRARHRSGWRGLAVAGVGPLALRGSASPGSLRAHPSRHGETPCHAGCYALRSQDAVETCPQAPERKWGACEHVSFPFGSVLTCFRLLAWTRSAMRFQHMCRVVPARSDKRK